MLIDSDNNLQNSDLLVKEEDCISSGNDMTMFTLNDTTTLIQREEMTLEFDGEEGYFFLNDTDETLIFNHPDFFTRLMEFQEEVMDEDEDENEESDVLIFGPVVPCDELYFHREEEEEDYIEVTDILGEFMESDDDWWAGDEYKQSPGDILMDCEDISNDFESHVISDKTALGNENRTVTEKKSSELVAFDSWA